MLLGCIADDFTGAGDLANNLARGGMRTRLFNGIPANIEEGCDAGVIALKSRSTNASVAVNESLAALDCLRAAGCRQYYFKYCSTFDSTAQGNIGPVAEALASALGATGVVVCPSFPATGRTVYQGHLFVGDRLLCESGMERHPITPMTDSDIRRWLARQSTTAPGHVQLETVRRGVDAIASALASERANGRALVVVDATNEDDLRAIGRAEHAASLVTGGSGMALGLPDNFRAAGLLRESTSGFAANSGDAALIAGSCSAATRRQIKRHSLNHPTMAIAPDALLAGEPVAERARDFLAANRGRLPLIFSSAGPEDVRGVQDRHGVVAAAALETLFGEIASQAVTDGFQRIVVAGGETSGAVVTALQLGALEIGPEIDPGVPGLSGEDPSGRKLAVALKSGNFGGEDFFVKAASALGEAK